MSGLVIPDAIQRMTRDTRLAPRSMHIWLFVVPNLVTTEFRPLVPADIAQSLALSRPIVPKALKELVECGYLEIGGRSRPNGPMTYRLPVTYAPPPAPAPIAAVRVRRVLSSGVL